MKSLPTHVLKAALAALHYTGAGGMMSPFTGGNGVIFMLHRVTPQPPRAFEPNRILKVTPDFLDRVIREVRAAGFEIVAMDDVPKRLNAKNSAKPFAAFTLDDGYRDNIEHAYPVFQKHQVPFTIYVPTDFADGDGDLWWLTLEQVLARLDQISLNVSGVDRNFPLTTAAQKTAAYEEVYWWLRDLPEKTAREIVNGLAVRAGIDGKKIARELLMNWGEVKALASGPLVTIGAHTVRHLALSQLPLEEARREIAGSIVRIEDELQRPCAHFSYPYGSICAAGDREFSLARELGVKTAVTTRKGLLYQSHADALTALPRLSLNGDFQHMRYVKPLLSGAPFKVWDAMQRFAPAKAAGTILS